MVLVQKKPFFQLFFIQYRPEKCFYDILQRQKRLSRLQKQEV